MVTQKILNLLVDNTHRDPDREHTITGMSTHLDQATSRRYHFSLLHRPLPALTGAALACLTLAGCGLTFADNHQGDNAGPSTQTSLNPAQPYGGQPAVWFVKDLQPASRVVNAGGVAVLFVHEGNQLHLRGYNPANGEQLWTRKMGSQTDSTVVAAGKMAAILENDPKSQSENTDLGGTQIVLLDPHRQGAQVGRSSTQFFQGLYPCEEPNTDSVCSRRMLQGQLSADHRALGLTQAPRMSQEMVQFKQGMADAQPLPSTITKIGDTYWQRINNSGLSRPATTSNKHLGMVRNGQLLWQKPEKDLSDPGYKLAATPWRYVPDADVAYTFQENEKANSLAPGDSLPMSSLKKMIAIKASTGERVWTVDGATDSCNATMAAQKTNPNDPVLVCVWKGGQKIAAQARPAQGGSASTTEQLFSMGQVDKPDLELVKLDPASGQRIWTASVGVLEDKAEDTYSYKMPVQASGDQSVLVAKSPHGPVVVSWTDGSIRKAMPDEITWQTASINASDNLPGALLPKVNQDSQAQDQQERPIGWADQPYAFDNPSLTITTPLPRNVGAQFDGIRVVATPRGILAYASPNDS